MFLLKQTILKLYQIIIALCIDCFCILIFAATSPSILYLRGYQRNNIFHEVQIPFLTDSHLFSVM